MANKPKQVPIKNSTIALYDILMTVQKITQGNSDPLSAWSSALEAKWNTPDFAQRYAEVMGLFSDLRSEISGLEPERTKNRIEKYYTSWWTAMVRPLEDWREVDPGDFISDSDLDILGTACDLIGSQRQIVTTKSALGDLEQLRVECIDWLSIIEDSSQFADETYRQVLTNQIGHLLWLIDNANTFGLARIVQQGDQITGTLVRAAAHRSSVRETSRFRDRITGFIAALTLVANLIHSSQVVYDATDHAIPAAEKVIREIASGIEKFDEKGQ